MFFDFWNTILDFWNILFENRRIQSFGRNFYEVTSFNYFIYLFITIPKRYVTQLFRTD